MWRRERLPNTMVVSLFMFADACFCFCFLLNVGYCCCCYCYYYTAAVSLSKCALSVLRKDGGEGPRMRCVGQPSVVAVSHRSCSWLAPAVAPLFLLLALFCCCRASYVYESSTTDSSLPDEADRSGGNETNAAVHPIERHKRTHLFFFFFVAFFYADFYAD